MVMSFRPPLRLAWLERSYVVPIAIDRLNRSEAAAIVVNVAGEKLLSVSLVDQIVTRTDGVPLFVEELTRMVLDSWTAKEKSGGYVLKDLPLQDALPTTLHGSLMARLDQISPVRRVAQIAAVIGREFPIEILLEISALPASAVQMALAQLVEAGLIFRRSTSYRMRYVFKHAMVRDAAYESLLKRDRRELHALVAAVVEQFPSRFHYEPDLLAHHYTEARLYGPALKYWSIAAQRALERATNVEVVGHTSKALEILLTLPDTAERQSLELNFQLMRGAAYWSIKGFASPEVEQTFTRAKELSAVVGNVGQSFVALRGLCSCCYVRGELARALEQAEQLVALARESLGAGDLCVGHLLLGQIAFWQGKFVAARGEFETVLLLYNEAEQCARMLSSQIDPAVNAQIHLGWTLWILGFPSQALEATERAITAARRIGQPFGLAMVLCWSAVVRLCRGERTAADVLTRELRAVTTEHQIAHLGVCATVLEGEALIAAEQFGPGIAAIRKALDEFRSQRAKLVWPWAMSLVAFGYFRAGMIEEGLATLDEVLAAIQSNEECQWEAEFHRLKGQILSARPHPDSAAVQACFHRAIDVARCQGAKSLELRTAMSFARILQASGDWKSASRLLGDIYFQFSEGFDTADLREASSLLHELQCFSSGSAQPQPQVLQ
jgi:tetratricopeptide (TPR) repeat protein